MTTENTHFLIAKTIDKIICPHNCCSSKSYQHKSSWFRHLNSFHIKCNDNCSYHEWKMKCENSKRLSEEYNSNVTNKPSLELTIYKLIHFDQSQKIQLIDKITKIVSNQSNLLTDSTFSTIFMTEIMNIDNETNNTIMNDSCDIGNNNNYINNEYQEFDGLGK